MTVNPTRLMTKAREFREAGSHREALNIYLFLADGDQSLDGGFLGERIGECYEALGDLYSAKYWYGRAVEENPEVRVKSVEARARLSEIMIEEL
jgi:tetratricopeptide (TPR) repeat protein